MTHSAIEYPSINLAVDQDDARLATAAERKHHTATLGVRESISPLDHLRVYLIEIRRYPLLRREEETELGRRVRDQGDERAVQRLITANLRLVVKIASSYHRGGTYSLLDLIQEGNLGLMQAARKFDPDRGTKFSYYAAFWIKAYILKYVMDNYKLVKIGTTQAQRKLFYKLAREKRELVAAGIAPEPEHIARRLNVKTEDVIEMAQRMQGQEYSLSAPIGDTSRETFESNLGDTRAAVDETLSNRERQALFKARIIEFRKRLTEREADILDNRILADEPLVLRELGEKYDISRERVRQIQAKIISDIKAWSEEEIPNFQNEYGWI